MHDLNFTEEKKYMDTLFLSSLFTSEIMLFYLLHQLTTY